MATNANSARLKMIAVGEEQHEHAETDFETAVRDGLTATPKTLPCRFFYDERGSQLFEEICELPEYYLTRAEHEILSARADEIAAALPGRPTMVELGSGSSSKTRTLIEAFLKRHSRLQYVPLDISPTILEESALALLERYPALEILAIAAEYRRGLARVRNEKIESKLILWLGSSVGNFTRDEAAAFLSGIAGKMSPTDYMLVGVDLRKDRGVLEAAYDDAAGVTAAFNKNLLERINAELGGNFDLDRFAHRAFYDEDLGRVEMHLVSLTDQRIPIGTLEMEVELKRGESIHTECSYKYSPDEIDALASASGLTVRERWLDDEARFSVNLLAPQCSS